MIDILIALVIASLLGLVVCFAYLFQTQKKVAENNISLSLILLAPIITIIMTFIGSNLALSLGMVGSLSIIRFRSAIKDSRDLIYLLWIMAIGIGCGIKHYQEAAMMTAFMLVVVVALKLKKIKSPPLTGSLILNNPSTELLKKLDHLSTQQIVSTPEKSEYIYQISLKEFDAVKIHLGPQGWSFIASREL
jgi:hypothetical protein